MNDFPSMDQSSKVIKAGFTCGLGALALGVLLYVSLLDVAHTWEVLTAFCLWVVSVALIAFIPVEATYHFLADLPLSVQIASLTAWLWAECVCRKLVKFGVTGPAYRNMVITRRILLSVFVVIVSVMLMKKDVFVPVFVVLFMLCLLVAAINEDIKRKKQMEAAQ